MYAAKLKRGKVQNRFHCNSIVYHYIENEALRSTMQTIETNLKEKDIYAVQLKEGKAQNSITIS